MRVRRKEQEVRGGGRREAELGKDKGREELGAKREGEEEE